VNGGFRRRFFTLRTEDVYVRIAFPALLYVFLNLNQTELYPMVKHSLLNSLVLSLLILSAPAVFAQTADSSLTFKNNFGETWVMDVVANTPTALHLEGPVYESDGTSTETGMAILLKATSTLSFTKGRFIDTVKWTGRTGRGVAREIGGSPEACRYRRIFGAQE
jgi:hypothetical protein